MAAHLNSFIFEAFLTVIGVSAFIALLICHSIQPQPGDIEEKRADREQGEG